MDGRFNEGLKEHSVSKATSKNRSAALPLLADFCNLGLRNGMLWESRTVIDKLLLFEKCAHTLESLDFLRGMEKDSIGLYFQV